jgi:hypothetical protein
MSALYKIYITVKDRIQRGHLLKVGNWITFHSIIYASNKYGFFHVKQREGMENLMNISLLTLLQVVIIAKGKIYSDERGKTSCDLMNNHKTSCYLFTFSKSNHYDYMPYNVFKKFAHFLD